MARDGITVRMARSMDRPMRYFLAKRQEGPALFVADRIDTLHRALADDGLDGQFHPSYTRMVPAHHIVEIALVGCPDPDPTYTRFFTPDRAARCRPISTRSAGATSARWHARSRSGCRRSIARTRRAPIGVSFSGGIDSGAVFLVAYHAMLRLGLSPARLKAFVLNLGDGPDVEQARAFLVGLGLSLFLEEIDGGARTISTSARRCACSRTTSRSTSNAPRWACCCAAASARAIRSGGTSPTATAATRTSRTIRSRRIRSSRSAASSTT